MNTATEYADKIQEWREDDAAGTEAAARLFDDIEPFLRSQGARSSRRDKIEMTDEINAETMQGDTPLEREINAYLTKQFIWPRNMPTDECLAEARHILALVGQDA